ncbi:MAG: DUF1501 domain-containing protein [Planctomycetota bacterium]
MTPQSPRPSRTTRRSFLAGAAASTLAGHAGARTLEDLLGTTDPLAPRAPHHRARARRVIFVFLPGGLSHVDSFDPKPRLVADHDKEVDGQRLMRPRWEFKPRGESGMEISELFPHLAQRADELCMVRSMVAQHGNHAQATRGMHTGSTAVVRPSLGAWVSYGLGSGNPNLPSFAVIAPKLPYAGEQVWGADFLPACHQGVRIVPGPTPLPNLAPRVGEEHAARELGLLERLNRRHLAARASSDLEARARSFHLAEGMRREAPEIFDLSRESDATLELYGLKRGATDGFAWQCLVARRLIERDVRFVELIDVGSSNNWDAHGNMDTHKKLARNIDRPLAGLLSDLRRRGLLEDTLVVCTTEFGRSPHRDKKNKNGRGHHPKAFSSWLAGAGVRAGHVHGATDEYGYRPAEGAVGIHDFHATLLHLCGFDHERLTFRHAGRDFRLTDVEGEVVHGVLA